MAENGIWSRGENSTKALTVQRKTGMPDRENATVKAVQPTSLDRAMNGSAGITQSPGQLIKRHNSMLSLCELRKA
jgi:hypothetical protein